MAVFSYFTLKNFLSVSYCMLGATFFYHNKEDSPPEILFILSPYIYKASNLCLNFESSWKHPISWPEVFITVKM